MKYYCKNCGSIFIPGNGDYYAKFEGKPLSLPPVNKAACHCPFCELTKLEFGVIPDYETPDQYKVRTGKPYPDNGLVWVKIDGRYEGRYGWIYDHMQNSENYLAVIASPPVPPPDDFMPEAG